MYHPRPGSQVHYLGIVRVVEAGENIGGDTQAAQFLGQLKQIYVHAPGVFLTQTSEGATVDAD
jgi:hypothetical protein